jgi:hypothetical protein
MLDGIPVIYELVPANLDEPLAAEAVNGLCTRVISKLTSHILRYLLRVDFVVNVQNFSKCGTLS